MSNAVKHAAENGMHALSPHLVCDGAADAIEFYKKAFNAEEMIRIPAEDGKLMHACVCINGSSVMLVDENKEWNIFGPRARGGSSVTMHLIVDDADAAIKQAEDAGAKIIMPAQDMFWGDRYGVIEDPFGHTWSFGTPQKQMSADEIKAAAAAAC